ncbi:metallophosphoesterase family protein [Parapusillimonas sp. SGNA-6]|nr:metallophosphoesterase family protein [Parapusillimonas sp. SGNA-6]
MTNKPTYSWVKYGLDESLKSSAETVKLGLVEANNRIHAITLRNLEPGKKYYYKVLSKDFFEYKPYDVVFGNTIESEMYSFTAPDMKKEEFSMLVLNDIHERPDAIEQHIGLHGNAPLDMVFFNGDIFNFQTDENQIIEKMIDPCTASFATHKPFLFVRGNHETRGKFARRLPDYFDNIDHAPYFTFSRGSTFFICLDSGEDKADNHKQYFGLAAFDAYREKQAEWLEQQLESEAYKKAKYRIVLIHIPLYHFHRDPPGVAHCRKVFGPLLNKYKIDLMISGHTHRYGFHEAEKGRHNYPIMIGGGPNLGTRTQIHVVVDKEKLAVVMKKDDGEVLHRYEVKG